MKTIQSAGVVTFFVNKDEEVEYLLLHYKSGHWEFPKGKLEANESKEDAALRELKEETGLQGHLVPGFAESFSFEFKDIGDIPTRKEVTMFVGEVAKKAVVLSDEHQDHVWLSYEEAHAKLTYENAQELLEKADDFIQELFTTCCGGH